MRLNRSLSSALLQYRSISYDSAISDVLLSVGIMVSNPLSVAPSDSIVSPTRFQSHAIF